MRVAIGYQFPVQLCDRVAASFPSFEELFEIGITAFGSRAWLLFGKRTAPQPAGNGRVANAYLLGDGGLREALLTQGYHLLVLSQAVLSFGLTQRNALWKRMRWLFRLRRFHVAVWQEIDGLMALQVDKDRPKSTTPSERKVINPKLSNPSNRGGWKRHHAAQNGHPRSLDPQSISSTRS
jgi:hypothetical protein